jgi:hypothetical protein
MSNCVVAQGDCPSFEPPQGFTARTTLPGLLMRPADRLCRFPATHVAGEGPELSPNVGDGRDQAACLWFDDHDFPR